MVINAKSLTSSIYGDFMQRRTSITYIGNKRNSSKYEHGHLISKKTNVNMFYHSIYAYITYMQVINLLLTEVLIALFYFTV